jgi:RND family efflux transporter MFP subunit
MHTQTSSTLKVTLSQTKTMSAMSLLGCAMLAISMVIISHTTLAQSSETKLASVEVKTSRIPQYIELDARVEAGQAATVAAQTSGRILTLYYDVNDLVSVGSPLLEITSKAQSAELAGAEAELAKAMAINQQAQAQYQRVSTLFPQGAISQGAMDEARATAKTSEQAISAAKANLIKAKQTLDYTVVSAPFSGRVSERHVQQGETVSLGQALFSGYDPTSLRLVTHLPQRLYSRLIPDAKGQFSTYFNQTNFTFEQVTVMAFSESSSHSHQVRISLENQPQLMEQLVPGQWLKVRFMDEYTEGLLIPKSALVKQGEFTGVYRIQGVDIHLTQVRVTKEYDEQLQVVSGLISGDNIALDAQLAHAAMNKPNHETSQSSVEGN